MTSRKALLWMLGIGVLWVLVLGWWASQPLYDSVPTTVDGQPAGAVEVRCASPIDSTAGPVGELPELGAGQQFSRPPCEDQHGDNRVALAINVVCVAGLIGWPVLASSLDLLRRRSRRPAT